MQTSPHISHYRLVVDTVRAPIRWPVAARCPCRRDDLHPRRPTAPRRCACYSTANDLSVLSTSELKAALLQAVRGTQRGKAASPAQRAAILPLLEALEGRNAAAEPARSPLLVSGVWALIYQAPLDEFRASRDISGTTEGPFLAALQPLSRGLVRTRANMQLLDLREGRAENLAEFSVAGGRWEGALNIIGTVTPQVDPQGGLSPSRVDVAFTHFELRLGSLPKVTVPLAWIQPKGWIETTYVDDDLRIGRGDKGSIFLTSRVKDTRWRGASPSPTSLS
ncbi:hypothetical protein Agub_g7174 [Astrephomene gubernaculifera]|uniref:Plastid lipid-associated protein/fibrillin conserved domain-containing protein n=1 Tax=Astrephomene gubernaculifera TaxID=47775 RepID=A0AAD3DRB3_9CHLO|nr:hypothetical protein Agub_g7174 [Astrephomene gubernaculifera]